MDRTALYKHLRERIAKEASKKLKPSSDAAELSTIALLLLEDFHSQIASIATSLAAAVADKD